MKLRDLFNEVDELINYQFEKVEKSGVGNPLLSKLLPIFDRLIELTNMFDRGEEHDYQIAKELKAMKKYINELFGDEGEQ